MVPKVQDHFQRFRRVSNTLHRVRGVFGCISASFIKFPVSFRGVTGGCSGPALESFEGYHMCYREYTRGFRVLRGISGSSGGVTGVFLGVS